MTSVLHQLNTIRRTMTKMNKQQIIISKKENARNGHAQINSAHILWIQFECSYVLIRQNTMDRTPAPHTQASFTPIYMKLNILNIVLLWQYCIIIMVRFRLLCTCMHMLMLYVCGGVYIRAKNHNLLLLFTTTFLSPRNEYI